MRKMIIESVSERRKGILKFTPNYVDACLSDYCPSLNNCFEVSSAQTKSAKTNIDSVIFQHIWDHMKIGKPSYSRDDLLKQIVITVFGVFNASHNANDPPPIPYYNLNEFRKQVLYSSEYNAKLANDISMSLYGFMCHVCGIQPCTLDPQKLDNAKTPEEFSNILINCNNTTDNMINLYDTEVLFDFYKAAMNVKKLKSTQPNIAQTIEVSTLRTTGIKFIQMVENVNAISAVGTLEYIDKTAKLNTTENICQIRSYEQNQFNPFVSEMKTLDIVTIDRKIASELNYNNKYNPLNINSDCVSHQTMIVN